MKQSHFPTGWDEKRVQKVLEHYEQQSEEEEVVEDENTFEDPTQTVIEVPSDLVPAIREMIARHQS